MPRKMEVQDYNHEWEREYLLEKNRLQHVLKEVAIKIHHIGSTAIPGIKAKPIIDILIEVTSIDELDELTKEMKELGYEAKGENGIKGRRYFQKGGEARSHHVHCYLEENEEIRRHLLFRDYLRAFPLKALEYSKLKEELSAAFLYDPERYVNGKSEFVRRTDRDALIWGNNKR
jgi:GrpB-like predicted nucleotidyltransferase (UPF0157 family)